MATEEVSPPKEQTVNNVENVGGNNVVHVKDAAADRKPTFKDVWANKRNLAWCLLIFVLPINFGYELSTVGNILAVPTFLTKFGVPTSTGYEIRATDQQLLNAATTVGLFVSAFATGVVSDFFGRRRVVLAACLVCIGGIIMQAYSTSIPMLFGGKLISVFGFGFGHSLAPVFVAEIAPEKLRGTALSLINTMIVIGQWTNSLTVYGTSTRPDDSAWRIPIFCQVIPPGIFLLIAGPFLPESPSWLILHHKREQAAKSLRRFNGPTYDVDAAIATIEVAIQHEHQIVEEKASYLDCFKGVNGRRTLIIVMVYLAQQFIGVNFIAGYLTYYFALAGVDNPIGIAQAAYAIQLFGNICSWPLIDRLGRRPLIVYGTIIMTAALLIIGGVSTINSPSALKATVALMAIWGFLYQASLGPAAYSVGGETASPRLRQKTYAINIMAATAVSCAVLQLMPILINPTNANLGGKITFVFFAPSFLMCIYLWLYFPECKGRTYAELEEMFQRKLPARQFKGYVTQLDVRHEWELKEEKREHSEAAQVETV